MSRIRGFRLNEIEAALRKAGGICSDAARLLTDAGKPCSRQNVYYWVHKHVRLSKAVEDCVEEIKDLAESKLIENIRAGETNAIRFFWKEERAIEVMARTMLFPAKRGNLSFLPRRYTYTCPTMAAIPHS